MELPNGYKLENVWKNKTQTLKEEIISLWISAGAIGSRTEAEKRVDQVIFLVRDEDEKIAAVSTIYEQYNQQLSNSFYYFRCFVKETYRRSHLAMNLLTITRDYLNQRFVEGEDTNVIGVLLEVESEILKKYQNRAVWPNTKFVYIGQNKRGAHLRVFYFDDAQIS